jgi:hypothetical protein
MRTYRLAQPVATFIIRLWVEPSAAGEGAWRGEAVHVQTGERHSFQDLSAACAFIQARVRSTQTHSGAQDASGPA